MQQNKNTQSPQQTQQTANKNPSDTTLQLQLQPLQPLQPQSQPIKQQQQLQTNKIAQLKHLIFKQQYIGFGIDAIQEHKRSFFVMDDGVIQINSQLQNLYGLVSVFSRLQAIEQIKRLRLYKLYRPTILQQINHLSMKSLIRLDLQYNNILSIESIHTIQFPSLKNIQLCHNLITSLKPLRKLYIPKITTLNLGGNPIIQAFWLVQIFQKQLENISLEDKLESQYYMPNINWYFKLESIRPRLGMLSSKRTNVKQVLRRFKQKIVRKQ